MLGIVFAVGVLGAVQTNFNNRASVHFGVGTWGTAVSFLGGSALLTGLVVGEASHRGQHVYLRWSRRPNWYHVIPGIMGVGYVTTGTILSGIIGMALYFVAAIVGQLVMSTLLDHYGWSGGGRKPLTRARALALAVALAGAVLSVLDRLTGGASAADGTSTGLLVVLVLVCVAVGGLLPVQTVLNRSASALLPSKLQTTWFSFAVGSVAALAALGVQLGAQPDAAAAVPARFADSAWYMYCGGALGLLFIASGIWFVSLMGAAAFFVALVCGQLVGSAVVDEVGLLGAPVRHTSASKAAGIVLVLLAAAAMQLAPAGRGKQVAAGTSASAATAGDAVSVTARSDGGAGAAAPAVPAAGGGDATASAGLETPSRALLAAPASPAPRAAAAGSVVAEGRVVEMTPLRPPAALSGAASPSAVGPEVA
jgi:transporter family-2 protein